MAKEKVFSETLNLRVDEAMSREIERIAGQRGVPASEAARMLIEWGIEAHRAREIALLNLRYDSDSPTDELGMPLILRVRAIWESVEPWEEP